MTQGGVDASIEECLQAERTGYEPPLFVDVNWDQVEEGAELPTIVMPITVTRCVFMASASRDFAPQHHNRDFAREQAGAPDMFLGTHFNIGMLSRFLTDWAGPSSRVRRIKLSMRRTICAGEDMIIKGRVSRRYDDEGVRKVDVDIEVSTQNGLAYRAVGTVVLATPE